MAGNVWEWISDQLTCNGTTCAGRTSTVDIFNSDFAGGFTTDGIVTWIQSQFRNDFFYVAVGSSSRGAVGGGAWSNGSASGRFSLVLNAAPTVTNAAFGSRCALPAE